MTEAMRELLAVLGIALTIAALALVFVGPEYAGSIAVATATYLLGKAQKQPDLIRDRKAPPGGES